MKKHHFKWCNQVCLFCDQIDKLKYFTRKSCYIAKFIYLDYSQKIIQSKELAIAKAQASWATRNTVIRRKEIAKKLDLCLKAFSFSCATIAAVCFFEASLLIEPLSSCLRALIANFGISGNSVTI